MNNGRLTRPSGYYINRSFFSNRFVCACSWKSTKEIKGKDCKSSAHIFMSLYHSYMERTRRTAGSFLCRELFPFRPVRWRQEVIFRFGRQAGCRKANAAIRLFIVGRREGEKQGEWFGEGQEDPFLYAGKNKKMENYTIRRG